jgi:mannosylglycerate hydrolase
MRTLHLVSHTHWDREWYLTFQQFRLKLVQILDSLLDLLESDPDYKHFMLDGQTIVLEDYLEMRPERVSQIRQHVKSGRLLIGPWYVLPDEFLVSPEAILRNLLEGRRTARDYGGGMPVGYIPDPFGHIGQMPQILRGFGLDSACLQRGLADEPLECWWQAPDGSRVFLAYLRNAYANAVGLPASLPEVFASEIRRRRDALLPYSNSGQHILLMHGNDHWNADPATGQAIAYAQKYPELIDGDRLVHSTLPQYIEAVKASSSDLITITGELRSSRRHNLLPGVLSSRIWIKQRNHACQTLLEKWAEPFSVFASLADPTFSSLERLENPAQVIRMAWRYLMECHPHDSICGCSIDQVHDEMKPRFDQVEQIGEEITRQSLAGLAASVRTTPPASLPVERTLSSVVVFNPVNGPSTGRVQVELELPHDINGFELVDEAGQAAPLQVLEDQVQELLSLRLDREAFKNLYRQMQVGRVNGLLTTHLTARTQGDLAEVEAVMSESVRPDPETWAHQQAEIDSLLEDACVERFHLKGFSPRLIKAVFLARQTPGFGYQTYWVRQLDGEGLEIARSSHKTSSPETTPAPPPSLYEMENEFLRVQASPTDGTFTLTDKASGAVFPGLNRFVDGGDRGDTYNYSPPPGERLVHEARITSMRQSHGPAWGSIEIELVLRVPCQLAPDRQSRSEELVDLPILTRATLCEGIPRLDFHTGIINQAMDHRLRVHFPLPFVPGSARYDGHFEIVERSVELPPFDETWVEQPRPEMPQRVFTAVSGSGLQLLLANRGLPEVQVIQEQTGGDIALTLLRCVGWLSRDDFPERAGPAGPALPTPGAQLTGQHSFDYSVMLSKPEDLQAYQQAYAFDTGLRAMQTGLHPGSLLPQDTFLEVGPKSFTISAIKMADDGSGWLVRGYNISTETIQAYIKPGLKFSRAWRVNLAEGGGDPLEQEQDGRVHIPVRACEIVTIKFTPGPTQR